MHHCHPLAHQLDGEAGHRSGRGQYNGIRPCRGKLLNFSLRYKFVGIHQEGAAAPGHFTGLYQSHFSHAASHLRHAFRELTGGHLRRVDQGDIAGTLFGASAGVFLIGHPALRIVVLLGDGLQSHTHRYAYQPLDVANSGAEAKLPENLLERIFNHLCTGLAALAAGLVKAGAKLLDSRLGGFHSRNHGEVYIIMVNGDHIAAPALQKLDVADAVDH